MCDNSSEEQDQNSPIDAMVEEHAARLTVQLRLITGILFVCEYSSKIATMQAKNLFVCGKCFLLCEEAFYCAGAACI